jgi:catechol 2,3-dioxygenase-like lactoylglutathione lyase family enzyme
MIHFRVPSMRTFGTLLLLALATKAQTLPPPGFHHLHLNSVDPEKAIDFYTRQFPSTEKWTYAGAPALKSGNVYVLFTKVKSPPPTEPRTAIWHFGWHVVDVQQNKTEYLERGVKLLPLYTTDVGGSVFVSSDTWPGVGGSLGLTKAQIVDAKAQGVQPTHGAGFAYLEAPDGAIVEDQGNMPAERFNHVHMFQHDPYCAELWYHQHLNAPTRSTYTEATCKVARPELSWPSLERAGMLRQPAGVTFDDVALTWHVQQDERPLAPTRGHLYDHVALSVRDLDAWIAKLRAEHVKFLTKVYKLGDARAVMIEGPSGEALELVEVK